MLLFGIMSVLTALPLSSSISVMSCQGENICFPYYRAEVLSFIKLKFPFLLSGSGARDLLQDGVWTLLLLLQADAAGPVHTGRYALCLW